MNKIITSVIFLFSLITLKKKPVTDFNAEITEKGERSVQRFWIHYRDSSAKLFAQLQPSINENVWMNWLTKIRTEELKRILELEKQN